MAPPSAGRQLSLTISGQFPFREHADGRGGELGQALMPFGIVQVTRQNLPCTFPRND